MIIGGGKISYYLSKKLLDMGIQVKIIERDKKHCEELSELLPKAIIINGDGTDQELLAEEGLSEAEGFAALTNMDEENIMLSLYAKKMSKAKKITKINRNTYDTILDTLDIGSVIHPKLITAESILQYVRAMQNTIGCNVETLYRLVDGSVEALEFIIREKSEITDIPLQNLELRSNLLVCAIYRSGRIIIPKGQDCLNVGDSVVVITTSCRELRDIRDIQKKPRSVSSGR
jgi:trk system potassium uptake protein TrkA